MDFVNLKITNMLFPPIMSPEKSFEIKNALPPLLQEESLFTKGYRPYNLPYC